MGNQFFFNLLRVISRVSLYNMTQHDELKTASVVGATGYDFLVKEKNHGQRLDVFLAGQPDLSELTRSNLQCLIKDGEILVNGAKKKSGYRIHLNDLITVNIPPVNPTTLVAEKVPFEILYEDDDIVVLSKPPGVVVHPACGHHSGTLVHGLLYHCNNLSGISGEERPGIVHRLDKDTSGAMVVAKNDLAHHGLIEQFKSRTIQKKYRAILSGHLSPMSGRIDSPIGRHHIHRKKMSIKPLNGREAITTWQVQDEFDKPFTYVELGLETGRTHQIRVHMAALGCPVAGDVLYGKKTPFDVELAIERQCLHSYSLSFKHPRSGKNIRCIAPLWPDIEAALAKLKVSSDNG